jgi:hypothetical protein
LKIVYLNGFTEDEKIGYKGPVYFNILGNTISLLEASQMLSIPIDPQNEETAKKVFSIDAAQDFGEQEILEIYPELMRLWQDPAIQACFARSNEFQLNDSAE